jgi:hypothetical protein
VAVFGRLPNQKTRLDASLESTTSKHSQHQSALRTSVETSMGYLPDSNDKNMRSGRPEQPKVSSKKLKKNEKAHDGVPKLLGEKFVRRSKIAVPKRRRGFQRCTASARGLYSDGEIRISAKRLSCPENARVPAVVSRASSCELSCPRKLPLGTLHFGETLEG